MPWRLPSTRRYTEVVDEDQNRAGRPAYRRVLPLPCPGEDATVLFYDPQLMYWTFGPTLYSTETVFAVSPDDATVPDAIIEAWMLPYGNAPSGSGTPLGGGGGGSDGFGLGGGLPYEQWLDESSVTVSAPAPPVCAAAVLPLWRGCLSRSASRRVDHGTAHIR